MQGSSISIYEYFFPSVTIFVSGALSLSVITLNRVFGIVMPKFANLLEFNRFLVYTILAVIWLISIGASVPALYFRKYHVSMNKLN